MEVGMHEAKTRLSELVKRMQAGEEIILTSRGEPVAELRSPANIRKEYANQRLKRLQLLVKQGTLGSAEEIKQMMRQDLP